MAVRVKLRVRVAESGRYLAAVELEKVLGTLKAS